MSYNIDNIMNCNGVNAPLQTLQLDYLQIVRDEKVAVVILQPLRRVEFFAVFDIFVFGVVKQEVFNSQPFG